MLQRDLNIVLKTENLIFRSSFLETGLYNTDEGCLLGETRMWQMAEGEAGTRSMNGFSSSYFEAGVPDPGTREWQRLRSRWGGSELRALSLPRCWPV